MDWDHQEWMRQDSGSMMEWEPQISDIQAVPGEGSEEGGMASSPGPVDRLPT